MSVLVLTSNFGMYSGTSLPYLPKNSSAFSSFSKSTHMMSHLKYRIREMRIKFNNLRVPFHLFNVLEKGVEFIERDLIENDIFAISCFRRDISNDRLYSSA